MLIYPSFNPIAFHIGNFGVYWYGIMYLIGFGVIWFLASLRAKRPGSGWDPQQIADLIFFCALGVVIGGRLGYLLFYAFSNFITHPLLFFQVHSGGMSFHGGLLGVIISVWFFARKTHKSFFAVGDFIVPLVPIGLGLGRIGNFINGELWGRVTDMPWGMVYPSLGPLPRHPSVLYEFFLEGVVLFLVLWIYSSKPRPTKSVSGLFLILYGLFRIFIEFFRQPDTQLGFVAFHWMTMGQLLSVPMVILGVLLYAPFKKENNKLKI